MEGSQVNNLPAFNGVKFDLHEKDGQKWITVKQVAQALGYSDSKKLLMLIDRNADEFGGNVSVLNLRTIKGLRNTRVLNYDGLITATYWARTETAKGLRKFATVHLRKMMFEGHVLVSPEHMKRLEGGSLTPEMLREELDRRDERLTQTITNVLVGAIPTIMEKCRPIPQTTHELLTSLARVEKGQWAVAARVVKERTTPFKWFNGGKAFDIYVAKHYRAKYREEPEIKEVPNEPGYTGPIWVYPRTREMIDWIMGLYRQYEKERNSGQKSLFQEVR